MTRRKHKPDEPKPFVETVAPLFWLIVEVRGGGEAQAVEAFRENHIDAYCPMERVWRPSREPYTRDREKALIPGYVFVAAPDSLDLAAITGEGAGAIWGKLMWNGRPAMVHRRDLGALIFLEYLGVFDHTLEQRRRKSRKFKKDERVRITAGHLAGAEAVITQTPEKERVWLLVDFGRGGSKRVEKSLSELEHVEPEDAEPVAA
jgi:transcription antitermination factor NusG